MNEKQMAKRKVMSKLKGMYVAYLNSLVSGKFGNFGEYENDFVVNAAEAVHNLHRNGYKVK